MVISARMFYDDLHNGGVDLKIYEENWSQCLNGWHVAESGVCSVYACKLELICFCSVHMDSSLCCAEWRTLIQSKSLQLKFTNMEGPELDVDGDDELAVSKPLCLQSCSLDTSIVGAW
jgi:hypothetical protein